MLLVDTLLIAQCAWMWSATPAACKALKSSVCVELPYQLWVAELGRSETVWLYHPHHNRLDVMRTSVGIAYQLNWELNETEIALYESERTGGPFVPAKSSTA